MSKHRDDEPSPFFSRKGGSRQNRPVKNYRIESSGPGKKGPGPTGAGPKGAGPKPGRAPRDHSVDEDSLDDFTPPNPKNPFAGAKPGVVLGALLSIGGILALIIVPFLPLNAPSWTVPGLIGVVLFGLLVLFLQMPRHRSGGGDGAQV